MTLSGSFTATSQIRQLKAGWNLVSAPTNSTIEASSAFRGVAYSSVRGADVVDGVAIYSEATTLVKGHAYWVHVSIDQSWSVPLSKDETIYTYDGDGGRVMRVAPLNSTVYIGSSYESEGTPGKPADKNTKHIYMGSTRICSIETTPTAMHTYYTHSDHLGSSNIITDESGTVVNILEYSPFGEVSRNPGNYSTDKRFTGKIYDDSSALYYYGARYYDPEIGRFITADAVIAYPNDPQCFNRYSYARNNPIVYIDPSGHFWWLIAALIGAIIGAATGAISAAVQGGNIGLGAAFGAVVGAFSGVAAMGFKEMMMGAFVGKIISPVVGGMITGTEFAIGGFGSGLITGYAGGAGSIGDMFSQAGIGAATGFGIGFAVGYSYTAGWQNTVHGANTQEHNANVRQQITQKYEAQIRALRTNSSIKPDKVSVIVGSRYLSDKSLNPGTFGAKHSFIGTSNPWEMGPFRGNIVTSDTSGNLSDWGTHITTTRAISSGAISSTTVQVSASGLREAMDIYGKAWSGLPYNALDHNSNYAVGSVIYGAGGDAPDNLGWTPGFPDRP